MRYNDISVMLLTGVRLHTCQLLFRTDSRHPTTHYAGAMPVVQPDSLWDLLGL